jgi:hypothetical protein
MPEKIQLRIDSPCAESWDGMQPNEEGRHCLSCQKTVVDFTFMSDEEILDWMATRGGSFCGRMQSGQLNRELVARSRPWFKGWPAVWRFLVAGILVSSEARAQSKPAVPPVVQVDRHSQRDEHVQGMFAIRPSVINEGKALPRRLPDSLRPEVVGVPTQPIPQGEVVVVGGMVAVARRPRRKPENILADTLTALRDTLATCGIGKKVLAIYPNPVAHGRAITITVRPVQSGKYMAQLYNIGGELEESVEIEGDRKMMSVLMNLPATLAAGVYVMRLSHRESGKIYSQQVVVF